MSTGPSFPPLMQGINTAGADPFEAACSEAAQGCDAGTILYDASPDRLRAAIVLAPEVPLSDAAAMLPLTGVAVQNALGALGPSELAVHLCWDGAIRVNGAVCGTIRSATDTSDTGAEPGWLVTGFELVFARPNVAGGDTPDQTDLMSEGLRRPDPGRSSGKLVTAFAQLDQSLGRRWHGAAARRMGGPCLWDGAGRHVSEQIRTFPWP